MTTLVLEGLVKCMALIGILVLGGALNAQAYIFKDALRPHGQERSADVRHADGVACGGSFDLDIPADNIPAFRACMRSHGWRFQRIVRTTASGADRPGEGMYTYNDVLKPHGRARGEAEEQAATAACDGGDTRTIGTPAFNACMRGQGWRFTEFQPQSDDDDQDKRNEDAANDAERRNDEQLRNDQMIQDLNNNQQ